jgi:hypothetical protein
MIGPPAAADQLKRKFSITGVWTRQLDVRASAALNSLIVPPRVRRREASDQREPSQTRRLIKLVRDLLDTLESKAE